MIDPYKNYKQISINTMTKGEQLVLLFDKAVQRISTAITMMNAEKFTEAGMLIDKTVDIFNYLMVCLNREYSISKELSEIYTFLNGELMLGKVKKDSSKLEAILPIVEDLRDTWQQADILARKNK